MTALTLNTEHWLTKANTIQHQPTPNTGDRFGEGLPDTVVIHFTGGRDAQSSADWLCNPHAKASAHVIIGKQGEIIQLADFNTITWHAGRSSWEGRRGLNRYSIGIELDNAGKLVQRGNGYYTWFGTRVTEDQVLAATRRNEDSPSYWHTYTEAQIERTEELLELLIDEYDIDAIVGHEEISPARKVDPGPAFPLDRIRERLLGDRSEELAIQSSEPSDSQGLVTAKRLNIRTIPNMNSPVVAEPLKRGTLVSIEKEHAGWSKVKVETEGWVKSEYLKSNHKS